MGLKGNRRLLPASLAGAAALAGYAAGRSGFPWAWTAAIVCVILVTFVFVRRGRKSGADTEAGPEPALVGRLASSVSHEFNNLLTAILGYSEVVLTRLSADDGNRPFLEEIRKAALRASEATGRLAAYGQRADSPESGPPASLPEFGKPEPGEADLASLRAAAGTPVTVLVVEDEESVLALVRSVLEARGYAVLEASGAREAMYIHENHPGRIDLLLTDIVLSGKSGREIARDLTELRPELRVIFMSGYADALIRNELERNSAAFLRKPFSPAILLEAVRQALESSRAPSESPA